MSLYAIADLHLSFDTDKPMDIFGNNWENHIPRLIDGFSGLSQSDTTVIAGDISWGMSLAQTLEDFRFIDALPGKKLILKGNHDYWWNSVTKLKNFFTENGITTIDILFNNAFRCDNIAIAGTRGWFLDKNNPKIYARELLRLETTLSRAKELDAEKIVCFMHYPPICGSYECVEITDMLSGYGVDTCYYGHLHGQSHKTAVEGVYKTVNYRLISSDYISFSPVKVS